MPVMAAQRECDDALADENTPEPHTENIPLYLLSTIPEACQHYINECLLSYEFQLQEVQAH